MFLILSASAFAVDIPVYIGEDEFGIEQNTFILDEDDSGGVTSLQFGRTLAASLQHDGTEFQFNDDVDFQGGELLDFRIENLASAPLCNLGSSGRAYFDTTDNFTYVCDGIEWILLDSRFEELVALQVREAPFAFSTSGFADIDFSTVDIENDPNVLERNDTNIDRIDIKEDGLYLISYSIAYDHPGFSESVVNIRMRENDSTVIPGSESQSSSADAGLFGNDKQDQVGQVFIADLNTSDFISLQISASVAVSSVSDLNLTVVKLDSVVGAETVETAVIDVYDSTGNDPITTTESVVNLDTVRFSDAAYTLEGDDEITFNMDGLYKITGRVSVNSFDTTGVPRGIFEISFEQDTTGSFLDVPGAVCYDYIREQGSPLSAAGCSVTWIGSFDVGDQVRLMKRMNSTTTAQTISNGSALTIELIRSE